MRTVLCSDVVVSSNQMQLGELIKNRTEMMKRDMKKETETIYGSVQFGFEFQYDKVIDTENNNLIFSCLIIYGIFSK